MDERSHQAGQNYELKNWRERKVGEISTKVQESRLKWYGHVLRRANKYVGKRVMVMEMPGKKERNTETEVVG